MKKLISIMLTAVLLTSFSACGGLHDSDAIYAKNLITNKSIKIGLDVKNSADTGNFSNFTTRLNYADLQKELESSDAVNSVTNIYHTLDTGFMKLDTDKGDFYIKFNSKKNDEYYYSFFADVGKAGKFGEYIYIPFYMLREYENSDYPANATPFEGEVQYLLAYDIYDFAEYYESKGIYEVVKYNENTLQITAKSSGYTFSVELLSDGGFVLSEEEYGKTAGKGFLAY